jgi:iron complex outermembrane recepter protein
MNKTAIASLLGLLFSPTIFAADNDAQTDEVIVTATRFSESNPAIPANITVISKEEIQATPAISIADILSTRAGVNLTSLYGRSGIDSGVDIRGFGDSGLSNTLILLDGQRINTVDASSIQWASIPLQAIDHIEIIRGSGGVLYGDRASGGVINLISDKSKTNAASAVATLGSYGYKGFDGYLAGSSENLYFNTFLNSSDGDGWRENTQFNQLSLSGRAGVEFSGGQTFIDYSAYRVAYGLPSSLINDAIDHPRKARTPFDTQEKEGFHLRPGISIALTDNLQFDGEIGFAREDVSSKIVSFVTTLDRTVETNSFTPRIRWSHNLGTLASDTVAGFDYYHGQINATSSASPDQDARQISKALYLQNSTKLISPLLLTVGGRIQNMEQKAHQDDGGPFSPAVDGKSDRTRSLYDVGLNYSADTWSAYAKTGSTFRYANTDELFGFDELTFTSIFSGDIKPQHGRTNEIGATVRAGDADVKISFYRTKLEDEIGYDRTLGQFGKNVNFDPTLHQGIETEIKWHFSEQLKALFTYAYTDAKFRSGAHDGKTIPSVPEDKTTLQLVWQTPAYGNYVAQVNHIGKRYLSTDFDNTQDKMPAYVTVDARASWNIKSFTLSASALNILDKRYSTYGIFAPTFADPQRSAFFPGDGRLVFMGLGYDFK